MNKTILIIVIILAAAVGGYFLLKGGYQPPTQAPTPAPGVAPGAVEEKTISPEETTASGEVTPTPEEVSPPAPPIKELTVSGTEYSFSPSSITVQAGDQVKITFQNVGGIRHNLVIEGLGVSTRTIGSGQTDTIEFTAPTSGNYAFFCSVPGHRAAGMEGQLKVE